MRVGETPAKQNGNGGFRWSSLLQWIPVVLLGIALIINWNTMSLKLDQHEVDMKRIELLLEAEITRGNAVLAQHDTDLEAKLAYADSLLGARQDAFRTRVDILDGVINDLRSLQNTDDTATQVALGQIRIQLNYLQDELEKLEQSGG